MVRDSHYPWTNAMEENIQNNIKIAREAVGITQQVLGDAVGVTRQTIIALERGNYTPSLLLAFRISRFFKKPIEDIFKMSYEK